MQLGHSSVLHLQKQKILHDTKYDPHRDLLSRITTINNNA